MAVHLRRDNKHTHEHKTDENEFFATCKGSGVCVRARVSSVSISTAMFNALLTFCAQFHFNHFDNCFLRKPTRIAMSRPSPPFPDSRFYFYLCYRLFSFTFRPSNCLFAFRFTLLYFGLRFVH